MPKVMRRAVAGVASLCAIVLAGYGPEASPEVRLGTDTVQGNAAPSIPGFAGRGSKIAFSADRLGQDAPDEIYIMNADGTGETRLTPPTDWRPNGFSACNALLPRWSPDGQRVAFHCSEGVAPSGTEPDQRVSEIFVTNGSEVTQLTHMGVGVGAASASWSPDGKRIAFGTPYTRQPGLWVIDVDGTEPPVYLTSGGRPDWSPDGKAIAFQSNREGKGEIYVMQLNDPADPVRLTDPLEVNPAVNQFPRWSPDGQKITFVRAEIDSGFEGTRQVYVMNADGTDQMRLTTYIGDKDNRVPGINDEPSWSPNGHSILFQRSMCNPAPQRLPNGSDLFAVPPDGSQEVRLTNGACQGPERTFNAHSTFSAFASWAPGNVRSGPIH
jgi:Tol biopolymer transport system component